MKKIRDLKAEVRQLLGAFSGCPPGFTARVVFERPERENRRSIRGDADASYFRPDQGCYLRVQFVPVSTDDDAGAVGGDDSPSPVTEPGNSATYEAAVPPSNAGADVMRRIVHALDQAERDPGKTFVAIKSFRDKILPRAGLAGEQAGMALNAAIAQGLLLTGKIPNPHMPGVWTTTVRLNREAPGVQEALSETAILEAPRRHARFTPWDLGPVSASAVVIRERR